MDPKSHRSFFHPFFMLMVTVVVLTGISLLNLEYTGAIISTKNYNLFSDLQKKEQPVLAAADTVARDSKATDSLVASVPDSMAIVDFGKDTVGGLSHFLEVLQNISSTHKKVRVGYYGDSMIEGDLLTQELRKLFQQRYGGYGVGIVPITSNNAGFRQSIRHTFSEDWETYSLLDPTDANRPIGMTGFGFLPKASAVGDSGSVAASESWVKYTAVAKSHLDKFYRIRLYYGKSSAENFIHYNNGYGNKTARLSGNNQVNEISLNENAATQSFYGSFNCKAPPPVYAMSFESDSGVFIDNFAFRGNSGMPLTKIPYSVLTGFNNYLHYDLIVLHYGLNATNPKVTDYSWYERGLNNMVAYFKSAFPNTSILVVSVNDKSYKKDGEYVTDPSVPIIVDVEKRVAEKNKVAFWNLYEAMGGYNSMVQWVTADTALANKDYTHPNARGANKIANMLYMQLSKELDEHKKQKTAL